MKEGQSSLAFAAVLLVAFAAVVGLWTLGQGLRSAGGLLDALSDAPVGNDPAPVYFTVKRGESAKAIAERLEDARLIRSAWFFSTLAQLKGVETTLKAGEYELRTDMRPSEILDRLQSGVSRGWRVAVPEGWRAVQVADLLEDEGITGRRAFLEAAARAGLNPAFGKPAGLSAEGYLFPDTYLFPMEASADDAVSIMLRNFERRVEPSLRQRAAARGQTIHQAVTLASIVEREAVVPSERPLIAGVYYNRLKAGMPLQADPTVQYAVAVTDARPATKDGYWKKELTKVDLDSDSPYNTYRQVGLPPGPIGNPGLASIRAVLEPADTDYLYFVARPDGSHAFARTFDEHLQNVRKYRP